jgi:hypothetical protein
VAEARDLVSSGLGIVMHRLYSHFAVEDDIVDADADADDDTDDDCGVWILSP